jgi:hypothetical protein
MILNIFNKKLLFIFLLISIYLAIFGPKIKNFIDLTYFFSFFYAIYGLYLTLKSKIFLNVKLFLISSITCTFSMYITNINNIIDITNLCNNLIKSCFFMLTAFGIYKTLLNIYTNKIEILRFLLNLSIFTVCIIIAMALIEELRVFIYDKIDLFLYKDVYSYEKLERFSDLSIGGTAISILFVISYLINNYLRKYLQRNLKYEIIYPSLLLIGAVLTARTGFIIILIIMLMNYSIGKYLIFFPLITIILILLYFTSLDKIIVILNEDIFLSWAFEPFINLITLGSFTSISSNSVINQFRFSDSLYELLFGTGKIKDGYGAMDSLFMQIINSSGLFIFFIFLINYIIYFGFIFLNKNQVRQKYYIILLMIIITIANLKDEYFGDSRGAFTFATIFVLYLLDDKLSKKNNV